MVADDLVERFRRFPRFCRTYDFDVTAWARPGWNELYESGSNLVAEGAENLRPVPLEVGIALEPARQQSTNALLRFPPR